MKRALAAIFASAAPCGCGTALRSGGCYYSAQYQCYERRLRGLKGLRVKSSLKLYSMRLRGIEYSLRDVTAYSDDRDTTRQKHHILAFSSFSETLYFNISKADPY